MAEARDTKLRRVAELMTRFYQFSREDAMERACRLSDPALARLHKRLLANVLRQSNGLPLKHVLVWDHRPMETFSVKVPTNLANALKKRSASTGQKTSNIIREALYAFLK